MDIVKRLANNVDRLFLAVLATLAEFNVVEITDEQTGRLLVLVLIVAFIITGVNRYQESNGA